MNSLRFSPTPATISPTASQPACHQLRAKDGRTTGDGLIPVPKKASLAGRAPPLPAPPSLPTGPQLVSATVTPSYVMLSASKLSTFPGFQANAFPQPTDSKLRKKLYALPELDARFVDTVNAVRTLRKKFSAGRIPLFCYGSLVDKASAGKTIHDIVALQSKRYVTACNVRRTFTKDVRFNLNNGFSSEEERSGKTIFRASLNMKRTDDAKATANGCVYWVPLDALHDLAAREQGYDLVPIAVTAHGAEPFVAYTFSVESWDHHFNRHICVLPRTLYLATVEAAMDKTPGAKEEFRRTTLLADGRSLSEYQP